MMAGFPVSRSWGHLLTNGSFNQQAPPFPMALISFSRPFLQWIAQRLEQASEGMLTPGSNLFMHCEQGVAQKVQSALAGKLGYCVEVSHASIRPEAPDDPNNRFANMEVEVTFARSLLCQVELLPLVDTLYSSFVGACTRPTPLARVGDIWVGSLEASVDTRLGITLHTFTVTTKIDLTPRQ